MDNFNLGVLQFFLDNTWKVRVRSPWPLPASWPVPGTFHTCKLGQQNAASPNLMAQQNKKEAPLVTDLWRVMNPMGH